MSNVFDDIKAGLNEAIDYAKGSTGEVVVHRVRPVGFRISRVKAGMTQSGFSSDSKKSSE